MNAPSGPGSTFVGAVTKKNNKTTAAHVRRVAEVLTTESKIYDYQAKQDKDVQAQTPSHVDVMEASGGADLFAGRLQRHGLRAALPKSQ